MEDHCNRVASLHMRLVQVPIIIFKKNLKKMFQVWIFKSKLYRNVNIQFVTFRRSVLLKIHSIMDAW